MKKIVCLILALCCASFLFACNGGSGANGADQAFFDVIESSVPTRITTLTNYTGEGFDPLGGQFVTVMKSDGFEFTYSYERFAKVEDAAEGNEITVEGSVIYKNGLYSTDDGASWSAEAPDVDAMGYALNATADTLGDYTISEDGTELTTTLTVEEAKALLGIEINANSNVEVVIKTNGKYLTRVMVYYTTESASVSIETSYSYNA